MIRFKASTIESEHNGTVKLVRSLTTKRGRDVAGLFMVEGRRAVWDALACPEWTVRLILACEGELAPLEGRLSGLGGRSVGPVYRLAEGLMRKVSEVGSPQGIIAVLERRRRHLGEMAGGDIAYLDRVGDPGNVGAIVRTAEAAGMGGVILAGGCADPYGGKAVRSSMGSVMRIPVEWAASLLNGGAPHDRVGGVAEGRGASRGVGASAADISMAAMDPVSTGPEASATGPDSASVGPDASDADREGGDRGPEDGALETALLGRLKGMGYRIGAAAVRGGRPYQEIGPSGRSVLVIGNEAHGVSAHVLGMCDALYTIPILGGAESLNAAVSASILIYERVRGRTM